MATMEAQLLATYVNKGRPGDGLTVEQMEAIVAMVFTGQDCYTLIEHEGTWLLQNTENEKEVEGLTGPLEMKLDSKNRIFLKAASDKRLSAPKVYADTLLSPIVRMRDLTREEIYNNPAFATVLPATYSLEPPVQDEHQEPGQEEVAQPSAFSPADFMAMLSAAGMRVPGAAPGTFHVVCPLQSSESQGSAMTYTIWLL